jgi:CTP:phosphocholine cytidylyltransferase-like protein
MTMWFYVKTTDSPKTVGDIVCAANVFEDQHPKGKYSWIMQQASEEETWQIRGKYEQIKDLTNVAVVYRAGDTIVLGEVNDDFVPNFLDALLEKYGFDNLKWIVATPQLKPARRWPVAP